VPLSDEPVDERAVEAPDVDRFWVDAALEQLPERERQVIELAYFHDLSQSAIAAKLRVPLGSVKSWTRRGLHRLATLLGEETA
jgi:RNA polymerase sigma-70 factor (ECF subfamily)